MAEFKNILAPVDLDDVSGKLVPYVQTMLEKHGADLHLLFVVPSLEGHAGYYTYYTPSLDMDALRAQILDKAQEHMAQFVQENFAGASGVNTSVQVGKPAEEIIAYAKDKGIDLIIMGTHGRTGLNHALFGSVAEAVIKSAPMPVMTINTFEG